MEKRVLKEVISWIIIIVIAFGIATFINKVIIFKVVVPSGSMENTIMTGDRVVTLRASYWFEDPQRGDIVVFPFPDNENLDYIKRVIGLPGEVIEGKDGLVYINGEPLEEDYVTEPLDNNFGPYEIPEDSYFMMGDNRGGSEDSRAWEHKYVLGSKIEGKAIFKYPEYTWFD